MPRASRFAGPPRVALPGSEKQSILATPPSVVRAAAAVPSSKGRFTVSVVLARKQPIDKKALSTKSRAKRQTMTRAAFAKAHGPDPASTRLMQSFAAEFSLKVESTPARGACMMCLSGTQAAMQKAFGVTLSEHKLNGQTYRVREGSIYLPQELIPHVTAVLGLDNRPQAQPHFRVVATRAVNVSYTPVQVAQLYGFPSPARAAGQTIGIVELGGGFRTKDITAYFKRLAMPAPTVVAVSVDKGKNAPSIATSADGEVMLDIEVCASVATGATIAVYFAPNTDQGFVDAISTAVHDPVNKPSVISISWGGPESSWTGQAITALDSACQAAAALGVTITAASGDNGSNDGVGDNANHVDFPASSPHVLACGGTKLTGQGSAISSEVVWNETALNEGATGGGVSKAFPVPMWQASANVPAGGRGVPDVSGNADPATGYQILVDGKSMVIGGTSAVAPLWAGLIAVANAQNKKSAGFINPTIYAAGAKAAFRDITQGNNGSFSAGPGWDACTGLGSPVGTSIVKVLGTGSAAKPVKTPVKKKA